MKLVKTSAIALAMSAILAGPVLAQGTSSDTQTRGGSMQGRSNMQGGASGNDDEEISAPQNPSPIARFARSLVIYITVGVHGL